MLSTSSRLKPLSRLKLNFIWRLFGLRERKFVQMVVVTWPRWPPYPYVIKTLKKLFLRNQKADDRETWCAELSAQVLSNLFKWWPWVDLDLFCGKVKFGPVCFLWEKGKAMGFSETIVVYDDKVGIWISKVRTFTDLGPRSLRFNILKFLVLNNR